MSGQTEEQKTAPIVEHINKLILGEIAGIDVYLGGYHKIGTVKEVRNHFHQAWALIFGLDEVDGDMRRFAMFNTYTSGVLSPALDAPEGIDAYPTPVVGILKLPNGQYSIAIEADMISDFIEDDNYVAMDLNGSIYERVEGATFKHLHSDDTIDLSDDRQFNEGRAFMMIPKSHVRDPFVYTCPESGATIDQAVPDNQNALLGTWFTLKDPEGNPVPEAYVPESFVLTGEVPDADLKEDEATETAE